MKLFTDSSSLDIEQAPSQQNNNTSCFPELSYKERMLGFLTCFIVGSMIQLMSFGSFIGILAGNPTKFALSFSLGNIVSLMGTCFLSGPKSQFKSMTNKTRLIASIVFIVSMTLTLISALVLHRPSLCLLFCIFQISAYIWYTASYIPFARSMIKSCFKKCLRM